MGPEDKPNNQKTQNPAEGVTLKKKWDYFTPDENIKTEQMHK